MSKRRSIKTAALTLLAFICLSFTSFFLYSRGDLELEHDDPIDQIKRFAVQSQLAEITQTFSSTSNIALVLAATETDDLTWLLDYCKDHDTIPFIYTTDPIPTPHLLIPRTIRGREAAAYLSYIVDFYDNLPNYSIFIHSNIDQWHNDLFGPQTRAAIRNLRLDAVDKMGYVNLRCEQNPGCPTSVNPWSPTQLDIEGNDIRAFFPEVYQTLFNVPREKVPQHIGNVCCGQFVVSKERILQRPKRDYERMLAWAAETEQTDSFGVGWVFEKVWHVIFGMKDIYCPRFEQCRCDVYGWCGPLPNGEVLYPV